MSDETTVASEEEQEAYAALEPLQRKDFVGIFEAMDGLPVVIRLIDPPLHEFLPNHTELLIETGVLRLAGQELEQPHRRDEDSSRVLGEGGLIALDHVSQGREPERGGDQQQADNRVPPHHHEGRKSQRNGNHVQRTIDRMRVLIVVKRQKFHRATLPGAGECITG